MDPNQDLSKKSMTSKQAGFQSEREKTESRSTTTVNNPTRNEENQPNPRHPISINPILVKNPACPIIQNTSPYTRLGLSNA